ncbi:3-keto-disaccharide hydrolase [Stratiformator vulcanicus]|uniref:3-keto-alpha-glucoside-1,2-lyase/3-keto-2-hydroxy-glucal hydratase domain-containing protein n=1 Tax=Stratiformator vulcanicus TaxID=2527980 RepID=A0A517QXY9_9PLAN|nr:DUF1080 domain-containing protein [Stratiformator vulcanicus]QDT36440.1 hypothetical protein Pan189_07960 [Stratiformator vulcanicus]
MRAHFRPAALMAAMTICLGMVDDSNAQETTETSASKEIVVPEIESTPFDDSQQKSKLYREGFATGYHWAFSKGHQGCPTHPSLRNLAFIRGWVEGWQAAIADGGTRSLPGLYAKYLKWDDEVRPEETGFRSLFDGTSTDGWLVAPNKPYAGPLEEGAIQPHKAGGRYVYHDDVFENFELRLEVKQSSEKTNSGIFIRLVDPTKHFGNPKKNPRSGFEIQVGPGGTGNHDFGAIYDLVPAAENVQRPVGEWNEVQVYANGPRIVVTVNGLRTATLNADEWAEPGKRPDGTNHKFLAAIAELPRRGHIGFQDHGSKAWFRNVRIRELPSSERSELGGEN